MRNKSELEIRYKAKVRLWYLRFERLSNDIEEIQKKLAELTERIDKIAMEDFQVMNELKKLEQEKEEMSFENVSLEQ